MNGKGKEGRKRRREMEERGREGKVEEGEEGGKGRGDLLDLLPPTEKCPSYATETRSPKPATSCINILLAYLLTYYTCCPTLK